MSAEYLLKNVSFQAHIQWAANKWKLAAKCRKKNISVSTRNNSALYLFQSILIKPH